MSKENPYFKFYTSEWLNGRITLEEYELQGLFINLCAYYWHSHGEVTISQAIKRFKNPDGLDSLLKENLIGLDFDTQKISIVFLDEQLDARGVQSVVNTINGKLGGRPKKTHSVNLEKPNETESKPINSNSNSNSIDIRKEEFKTLVLSHPTYSDIHEAFIRYWSEPNQKGNKMKFELEKTWDTLGRLATWRSRQKQFTPKAESTNAFNDPSKLKYMK